MNTHVKMQKTTRRAQTGSHYLVTLKAKPYTCTCSCYCKPAMQLIKRKLISKRSRWRAVVVAMGWRDIHHITELFLIYLWYHAHGRRNHLHRIPSQNSALVLDQLAPKSNIGVHNWPPLLTVIVGLVKRHPLVFHKIRHAYSGGPTDPRHAVDQSPSTAHVHMIDFVCAPVKVCAQSRMGCVLDMNLNAFQIGKIQVRNFQCQVNNMSDAETSDSIGLYRSSAAQEEVVCDRGYLGKHG